MSDILKELEQYPDPMSKAQFCRACHISNTTGAYLVASGLVPSTRVGKSQWFVFISKADVKEYLKKRQTDRRYYQEAPIDPSHRKREQPAFAVLQSLEFRQNTQKKLSAWIRKQFYTLPDILRVDDVRKLTGYQLHTVSRWCTAKRLPCTIYHNKALIAKSVLIDFLASEDFNCITRKSELHYKILVAFQNSEDLPEWKHAILSIKTSSRRGV